MQQEQLPQHPYEHTPWHELANEQKAYVLLCCTRLLDTPVFTRMYTSYEEPELSDPSDLHQFKIENTQVNTTQKALNLLRYHLAELLHLPKKSSWIYSEHMHFIISNGISHLEFLKSLCDVRHAAEINVLLLQYETASKTLLQS